MTFLELINKRQSVRRYKDQPVPEDMLLKLAEAARLAPSACNSQPWSFIFVNDSALKEQIARATWDSFLRFNRFVMQAPVILVIVMEKPKMITQLGGRVKKREYPLYDIGIVAEHVCLQATEMDLGSCMIGWFDEKKIMKLLHIPEDRSVGLLISLGYPAESYKLRTKIRKPLRELVTFNSYKTT